MKQKWLGMVFVLTSVLTLSSCLNTLEPTDVRPEESTSVDVSGEYMEGELFVKFAPEVEALLGNISRSGATRSGIPSVDEILDIVGGYHIERVFPIDCRHEERTRKSGMHLWYIVRFEGENAGEVAKKFERLGEVEMVEMNHIITRTYDATVLDIPTTKALTAATPAVEGRWNDPLLPYQWTLINDGNLLVKGDVAKSLKDADVQVEQAWKKSVGSKDIIVAVLDEAVWPYHPDLQANMWVNEDEVYGDKKDNDGNGYSGDYHGYDFVNVTGDLNWASSGNSGHGTHVAGVIGAVNNNGTGISSIAGGNNGVGGVKIMSCQVFSGNDSSTALQTIRAMKYAADNGAVIMQCSWGYPSGVFKDEDDWATARPLEKIAMDYFIHQAGSPNGPIDGGISIWAAGNDYTAASGFPAGAEAAISVASIGPDYTPAVYTNYNVGVDIAAPGGDIYSFWTYDESMVGATVEGPSLCLGDMASTLSTLPLEWDSDGDGYGYMQGTSMACPHVSGAVALAASYIAENRRIVKAEDLRQLLFSTARKLESLWPIEKKLYLTGRQDSSGNVTYFAQEMDIKKNYTGAMGYGLVNTTALLNAVDGLGVPMTFPNVYVGVGNKAALLPAIYFVGGEQMTYTIDIQDKSIASCTLTDGVATFEGLKAGSTEATITTSGGTTQEFRITVRKGAGENGWL